VSAAVRGNPDLRSAEEKLRAARASERGAYAGFFPQLNASLGYTRGKGGTGAETFATPGIVERYSATLSASQNLFAGLLDRSRVRQASANVSAAEAALVAAKAKASFDLKSSYSGLVFAQESVRLQKEVQRRRADNLRLVELRFESGRENKGSVLLSKAYLEQANYDSLQARNAIGTAQAQLARLLGREDADGLAAAGEVPVSETPAEPDFRSLAAASPDTLQAEAQAESSRAVFELARGAFFPTLGVEGSLGRQGTEWFPANERWSVGVSLTVPLFSGGRDYFATKSASANWISSEALRQGAVAQSIARLRETHAAALEAAARVRVEESFLAAARTRAEVARNKYNNGLTSFEDWDQIENELIARQKSVLSSRRDRVTAEAAYEQAQGKGAL
jgi:outer membrane protein TolC